jgi:DNA mismatch repair protein MutS
VSGAFESILFPAEAGPELGSEPVAEPPCFADLNFGTVVEAVAGRRQGYGLEPFFALPLRSVDEVEYRHEVFRDLEQDEVLAALLDFSERELGVRRYLELVRTQEYLLAKQHTLLEAAARYTRGVAELVGALEGAELASRGLCGLRAFLAEYTASPAFQELAADARSVLKQLDRVNYTVRIKGNRVTVGRYEGEPDYTTEIEDTFERFRRGPVEDHLAMPADSGSMDLVEAEIARRVAKLFPQEFAALADFWHRHRDIVHPTVARFEREVQFYLAWLEQAEELRAAGMTCCLPAVSTSREVRAEEAYDLALALKRGQDGPAIVPNDVELRGSERILVVSGPNQGGKTTFARTVGQLHQLARIGAPVPARRARLPLVDAIFTHFERQEEVASLRGKLDDELLRMKAILEQATSDSLVILNEIFSATSLADAVVLGREVLGALVEIDCLGVCVTFVDELASLGPETVSMVAEVDPADPSIRTFRVVRKPADGRAFAAALAEKYGLSYRHLRERLVAR